MKIFVTGGSGFAGQHIIRRLVRDGHDVTAHARSEDAARKVRRLGVRTVVASLTDEPALLTLLVDQQAVVHVAAYFQLYGRWPAFQEGIIDATLALHRAATAAGVRRFVYVSASGVVSGPLPVELDETAPYPRRPLAHYGHAKALNEQALRRAPKSGITAIILRPPLIWGPDMPTLETYAKAVQAGQAVWLDSGRRVFDTLHIDNLAQAIVLALTQGRDREVYLVTDDAPTTVKAFFTRLLATRGVTQGERSLPSALARPLARLLERVYLALGRREGPPISPFFVEAVGRDRRYDIGKIKRELGYRPVLTPDEGFAAMRPDARPGQAALA